MPFFMGCLWLSVYALSFIALVFSLTDELYAKLFMLSSLSAFFAWLFSLSMFIQCIMYLFSAFCVLFTKIVFEAVHADKALDKAIVLNGCFGENGADNYAAYLVSRGEKIYTAVSHDSKRINVGSVVYVLSDDNGILTVSSRCKKEKKPRFIRKNKTLDEFSYN